jgi:hypothetical protein
MSHVAYPAQFPARCVADLIQIARGGLDELRARKAEVGLHAWNIQGFAQSVLLGNPEPIHGMSSDDEANLLEQLNELNLCVSGAFPSHSYAAAIDWRAALKFFVENVLPILLPLILNS